VVSEIAQGNTLRLLARNAEQVVESAIGSLNLQAGIEHDKRVDYRIQDRFGVFPLIDSLPEACAESGEIRERKYRAACLPLSYCVGGDTEQKPPVIRAHLVARWHSINHHLNARLLDFGDASQCSQVASMPPQVRCGDAKHFLRRTIETCHRAVAPNDNDRNVDRIQDADNIEAGRGVRSVALHPIGHTNPYLGISGFRH